MLIVNFIGTSSHLYRTNVVKILCKLTIFFDMRYTPPTEQLFEGV